MVFCALKPCNFGGVSFRIGENVPDKLVAPSRVRWFIMNGYLAETPERTESNSPETVMPEVATSEMAEQETTEPGEMAEQETADKSRKTGKSR